MYWINHPLLNNDGSLVFNGEETPLIKIDKCSNIVWSLDYPFHHSIERDHEKNYWVPMIFFPKINHFFEMILGSPTEKKDNLAVLLSELNWSHDRSVYVGDSNNDLEAAKFNNLEFVGRSSGLIDWEKSSVRFVSDLASLHKVLY